MSNHLKNLCQYNKSSLYEFSSTTLPWSIRNPESTGGQERSSGIPSFSLHKTRSSPSIFAMSAKSGLNPDLLLVESSESSIATSSNDLLQANIDMVAHNIHTYYNKKPEQYAAVVPTTSAVLPQQLPSVVDGSRLGGITVSQPEGARFESRTMPKNTDVSPSALRRSLTMHYDENCDLSNKSSTLPHDFNKYLKSSFLHFHSQLSNLYRILNL